MRNFDAWGAFILTVGLLVPLLILIVVAGIAGMIYLWKEHRNHFWKTVRSLCFYGLTIAITAFIIKLLGA